MPPVTEPFLQDPDVTLLHGDVLERLRELPDESVDCVITSPPYWGLRDYGTGTWEGGNQDCDHLGIPHRTQAGFNERYFGRPFAEDKQGELREPFRDVCGKCGAQRIDNQIGLENTPDAYIARMVEVFREVRRVLAAHGTCWINMGDGYASQPAGNSPERPSGFSQKAGRREGGAVYLPKKDLHGLKPKDLVGMPWRLAFALQTDGWYLRADIIWAKPNPMPESVTDRPTKAHEYVFLLAKRPRYWFDQEAVREPAEWAMWGDQSVAKYNGTKTQTGWMQPKTREEREAMRATGRNIRSVWEIATQPYPEAHFATYPEELVRRCLLAGCAEWVCRECGKPRERIVESEGTYGERKALGYDKPANMKVGVHEGHHNIIHPPGMSHDLDSRKTTLGWSDCGHDNYRPGVVLDPFVGSGTTALVARNHGRHAIGIDLRADYCRMAARRLQQLSLLAETR